MLKRHSRTPSRIAALFAIVIFAVVANSCGHSSSASTADRASMETVMQAIQDYGRGHVALPTPAAPSRDAEADEAYRADIGLLLAQENFAELEKIAEQNRNERGLFVGGAWKNNAFFNATGPVPHDDETKDSDYKFHIRRIEKWIAAYPQSSAARISLARAYTNYASFARGDGMADEVSDSQWQLYSERAALAKDALLAAADFKERDPHWYEAMQQVAFEEGWHNHQARQLLDQAVAFEPGYYHYYREYADYLKPQWFGKPGDIKAFADEASSRLPEPDSSILYFRIVSSLACNCKPEMEDLPYISLAKISDGYKNAERIYGYSNLNANRFAFMAVRLQDKAVAGPAFADIQYMEPGVWGGPITFNSWRDWATSP
jgi:hypothetical protein